MNKVRISSRYTALAISLLGKQIQLGRKQRKWSEAELASRAGIARATLQKIEKGDPHCAIGLVFEVAALVDIQLFEAEKPSLAQHIQQTNDKIALLPKRVRSPPRDIDDDF
ncbi:MAG: helix-turn-helix domain-containing protein [Gammaproteobacteria bacterium]|nr:helix-turn-helix domain-containing protein [Gammaproteobacteria bacterium]